MGHGHNKILIKMILKKVSDLKGTYHHCFIRRINFSFENNQLNV